jgi:hypothetical protein
MDFLLSEKNGMVHGETNLGEAISELTICSVTDKKAQCEQHCY